MKDGIGCDDALFEARIQRRHREVFASSHIGPELVELDEIGVVEIDGTPPPSPTWFHAAARNSVRQRRLSARARTRSGATTMTVASSGKNVHERHDAVDENRQQRFHSRHSDALRDGFGKRPQRRNRRSANSCCALARTAPRAGFPAPPSVSTDLISPSDRWSAIENSRRSSMSSPKKSHRTGCPASGGKTSRIPPRMAISPRRETRSTR
jgi:hypothetical protein